MDDGIVKICKKHGKLTIENTYLLKTKSLKMIRMCYICKKSYRYDWGKLNPEKLQERYKRNLEINSKKLLDGTLTRKCKTHGDLPIEKIRVNSRGETVCRICCNLSKKRQRLKDPEGFKEKYNKWLYSDRERVQRYYKNDKPKRRIRQNKAYHRRKLNDPIKHLEKQKMKEVNAINARKRLDDSYINSLLKTFRKGGINNKFYHYFSGAKFPKQFIDFYKEQIKIKRKLKEIKCQK